MQKITIGIVGYGKFGRFIAKHLRSYVTVIPITRTTDPSKLTRCNIVIYAVPWGDLETAVIVTKPYIAPDTLIVDVTSVKQKPLALLKKHFPQHSRLGTHPIFGPQSGKKGIAGLPIVLTNDSVLPKQYRLIRTFLRNKLQLRVFEMSVQRHDHEMAQIQGLTHFIGRALLEMNIQSFRTNTQSYAQLLGLADLLRFDSWELFKTIQNSNPEAKVIRQKFTKTLTKLEKDLQE